jgi:small multidrug resistance family-3 protein
MCLALFVWLLTLHPAASGRVYAAYGGVYVVTALVWLRVVDGIRLSAYDLVGAGVVLAGVAIITAGWHTVSSP